MDPLSRLPLECLQHILDILSHHTNTHALATLLCTNKHIALVTLPYLYTDPFRLSSHTSTFQQNVQHNCTKKSGHAIVRTLLAQLPFDSFLLRFALQAASLDTNTPTSSPSPPLDYFAHVRHLHMDKDSIDIDKYWPQVNTPPGLLEFVQGDEYGCQCGLDRILPTYYGRYTREFHLRQLYRVMLFREATWAIAEPILERLQSLTVPISAIECYLKVLARLERLESVQFLLDEFFDYKSKYVWSGALEEFMFPIDDRKSRAMGGMIWFVMEHGRLFPNQLVGGASVVDGEFFADAPQSCTKDIQLEVARWLPPLRDISTVTDENWLRLEAHIKMVDLERVQSIVSRDYSDDALMSLDIEIDDGDERPFLQRCRGLKTLEIMLKRANLFGWAVKEKQRALELPVSGTSSTLELPAAARTPSVHPQQDLVPLAKVTLAEYSEAMSDAVHDITFAFSLTLTHLNILVLDEDRSAPIRFGHGWADLPVLTHLTLKTTDDIADIEERLLHRCPSLISITLSDNTCYYNCLAITTNAPLNLPHLEHLDLIGRSALTFHPATLNSTPNLISLRLRMVSVSDNINDVLFIPLDHLLNQSFGIQDTSYSSSSVSTGNAPPQQPGIGSGPEVLVRPWWSWEWRLLHLKTLHLNAEFAFRFKFKMLRGCPVLESMSLEIQTRNQRHQEITQEDLFASSGSFTITPSAATTATTVTGVPEATEERIVLPRLRRLQLTGPWKIEHSVMSDLLLKMCPKVEELHLLGWKKATLVELIDIVREMYRIAGRIREVHVGTHRVVPLGLEKMRLMGMYPPAHAEVKGKEVLPIDICALGSAMEVSLRFFLLKDLIGKGSDAEF